jgi:HEAT repeat protein
LANLRVLKDRDCISTAIPANPARGRSIRKIFLITIAILLFYSVSEAAEYLTEDFKVALVGYKNVNMTAAMPERDSFELMLARQLSREASKQILMMRESTNASVTDATSNAVARTSGFNALDSLILALGDTNVSLRQSAAKALGEINDTRAVDPLIDSLNDTSRSVQCEAVEALGKIGDKRATYPLILRLENWLLENREYNYTLYSTYEHFGLKIALSLVRISDPTAIELLIQCTKSEDKDIRALAAAVLSAMKDPIAVDPLIKNMNCSENDTRGWSAFALGQIGDRRAVEPLIMALNDTDIWVRARAAEALGVIGDERAVEALTRSLKDRSEVQKQAEFALNKIGKIKGIA